MVWILQELKLVENERIEILLELPMRDEEEVETACKIRMRNLCARELGTHAVRALKGNGEMFLWTLSDEQNAPIGLGRSAEEDVAPQALLDAGADPLIPTEHGTTALMLASGGGTDVQRMRAPEERATA